MDSIEKPEKTYLPHKPMSCPSCSHSPVAKIEYGLMDITNELRAEIDAGITSLGGCFLDSDNPSWICSACKFRMWRTPK